MKVIILYNNLYHYRIPVWNELGKRCELTVAYTDTEEFTKYSFPSKNMDYMVSGTPLFTTRLPGMPEEYYPYVFLFDEETVEGYRKSIESVLSMTAEDLIAKGNLGRRFVVERKNNILQTKRILDLLQK